MNTGVTIYEKLKNGTFPGEEVSLLKSGAFGNVSLLKEKLSETLLLTKNFTIEILNELWVLTIDVINYSFNPTY